MRYLRRLSMMSLLATGLLLVFIACKGDTGPMGPPGEQGDPGPGTRYVMTGDVPLDQSEVVVPIDGFNLIDPALVTVFIDIEGKDEWDELPVDYIDQSDQVYTAYASLVDGGVKLYNCNGFSYIIIIIE
jgi:hypothetical protein